MPAYRYEAVDASGQARYGSTEAVSPRQARDQLRAAGLLPIAIEDDQVAHRDQVSRQRLREAELALLTQQWSTLLAAGMPIEQTLTVLIEQNDDVRTKEILNRVRTDVLSGQTLARALANFPRTFSELYQNLASVGSETGQLAQVLSRMADYLTARDMLRQRLTLALLYPTLVTVIAIGVIAALLLYVVPQVVAAYQQTKQVLPWLTQALIAVSGFLRNTIAYWLTGFILTALIFYFALKRPEIRQRWHSLLLRLPGLGNLLRSMDAARFASTLSILVASGSPMLRALTAAKGVLWCLPLREAVDRAVESVREGVSLTRALAATETFPPMFIHLLASGEVGGQLAAMLERAALQQQREAERKMNLFMGMLGPLLIVIVGALVLFLVLAIMLPIISMNQLVR